MKDSYKGIVVHCSDSKFGNSQIIEDWHKQRGWSDIGYHFVILNGQFENNSYFDFMDGMIESARDIDLAGAHALGYNDYLGICLIGVNEFTEKQFLTLNNLIKNLCSKFHIDEEHILFHYEISDKTCPNFNKEWFFEKYLFA